jgi:predicted dehydrogenase
MVNRIGWGVLGAAGIAVGMVIPAIQQSSRGRVVALGSRDQAKAKAAAVNLGIERVHASYEAVLADPGVDAVYIPLPNSLHVEWIMKAAAAGKHVLCEKPIALTAAEATAATTECARRGVKLMEGFMYRFHPQTLRVQELLASGVIGEVREAHVHLSVNFIDVADPGNVRFLPALGGGALLDMGCYTVNAARMIFNAEPRRAIAHLGIDNRYNVDRHVHGVLEFDQGIALISCGFDAQGLGHYSITGTKGMIEVPRGFIPGYGSFAAETMIVVIDGDGNRSEEHLAAVNQYGLMADAFCEAIAGGKEPLLPPSDSIRNMEVIGALQRSSKSETFETVAAKA